MDKICKNFVCPTSPTWSAAATSPKLQSKSLERISPVVLDTASFHHSWFKLMIFRDASTSRKSLVWLCDWLIVAVFAYLVLGSFLCVLGAIFLGKSWYLLEGVLLLKMLYYCQIQVARSPRLWKHVGSPFASLVVLDQSRSLSRSRAISHRWWRDHPKLCKPASMQILSGTSRPRWCCHLLQSWLVWGAPCLLCCPAAPSAPPSALSLEHPEWKVAKETNAKKMNLQKILFAWIGCHNCRT